MPITLNDVDGLIDAEVVEENFKELEDLLRENLKNEDFNDRFGKYKIRRYTGGKISSFNFGSNPYSSSRDSAFIGTFENNWINGLDAKRFCNFPEGKGFREVYSETYQSGGEDTLTGTHQKPSDVISAGLTETRYNDPSFHPFELMGFPGGSLYYDFIEQGIPRPNEIYSAEGKTLSNFPPRNEAMNRFPRSECWSRWLTVPDAAGSVYVDEPCVALITATVKGNYFFTPAMRIHGPNVTTVSKTVKKEIQTGYDVEDGDSFKTYQDIEFEVVDGGIVMDEGMLEGADQSAMLRLGLFVDTNPIVYDDEFYNGDDYGKTTAHGHGYNPWIGDNPTGKLEDERPDGVAKTRSWIKVKDITYRVRQRGTYQITAAVQLKGRRKYNFSLKFRPAGHYGFVESTASGSQFVEGYAELAANTGDTMNLYANDDVVGIPGHVAPNPNPALRFGKDAHKWAGYEPGSSANPNNNWNQNWLWPGVDALVTNFIESTGIGVEFFYGQQINNYQSGAKVFRSGYDENY